MLVFLVIVTVISIYILNIGLIKNKENVTTTGVIMLFMIVFLGWLAIGVLLNIYDTEYKTNVIYQKNENEFIIKDSLDNNYIFNKKIDFDFITDTTTFYIIVSKNMYGGMKDYNIFYKVGDRKIKGKKE